MAIKFVQDINITSGQVKLDSTVSNKIETSGNLQIDGNADGANSLNFGTGSLDWKSLTVNAGAVNFKNNNANLFSVAATGNSLTEGSSTADSFIKDGGTSSQFLKADGSVDTSTYASGTIPTNNNQLSNGAGYALTSDTMSISGGTQSIAGNKTFTGTTKFGTFGNLNTSTDVGMQFELGTTALNTMRTDADAFRIYFGGTSSNGEALKILQTGEMTLKTQGTTEYKWDLDGDFHADGDVIAYSTTVSDKNLKENISTIENATETVKQLRGDTSTPMINQKVEGQTEIGVIAQEVEQVLPFLVREKNIKGKDIKTVDYEKIIGLLIESNKELSNRLDLLELCACKKYK